MRSLELQSHFSSAHRYAQPLWDDEKNRAAFGRCFTPYGHGHNYRLEVRFLLPEAVAFSKWRRDKQKLLDRLTGELDHEHLNFSIPAFKDKNPTTENIALYFREKLCAEEVSSIRVFEMPDLWTEILP